MTDREALELGLKENAYNADLHMIYADLLELESTNPQDVTLALWHREWTPEKQRKLDSENWLREFASNCGSHCENYDEHVESLRLTRRGEPSIKPAYIDITYEMTMAAAKEFLETHDGEYGGNTFCQDGSQRAGSHMDANLSEFWKHYQIVTETEVPEERQGAIFSCTC